MKLAKSHTVHRFIAIVSLTVITAVASPEWFLMGRHDESAPLSSLARKGPEFRGLETPYQLIDKMRAAGHQVDVKEHRTPNGPMVEVHVAAKGLALMVVPADPVRRFRADGGRRGVRAVSGDSCHARARGAL